MRFFLAIVFLLTCLSPPVLAGESESVELEHQGVAGYWFPDDAATLMLKDLREVPLLRKELGLYELKISRVETFILLLKQDIEVTEQISNKWQKAFQDQVDVTEAQKDYYEDQLAEEKKWYRAPIFWVGVGLVVGAGLTIGVSYALADAYNDQQVEILEE